MKKIDKEFLVGLFVTVGFILATFIFFFVSGISFFKSGYTISVDYPYVSILERGAPVRMGGVKVGEVSNLHLIQDAETGRVLVRVELFIEKGVKIRENYLFTIRGTHILSEPHIEITPLPSEAPFLEEGDRVRGVSLLPMEDLIERAHAVGVELESLLRVLRQTLEEGEAKEVFTNFNALTESLARILERVRQGEGTVGKLLTDDRLYQEMSDLIAEIKARPWRLLKKDEGDKKFLGVF